MLRCFLRLLFVEVSCALGVGLGCYCMVLLFAVIVVWCMLSLVSVVGGRCRWYVWLLAVVCCVM